MIYEFEPQNGKRERTIISVQPSNKTIKISVWDMRTNEEKELITLPFNNKEILITLYKNGLFIGNFYTTSSLIRAKRVIVQTDNEDNCISASMVI